MQQLEESSFLSRGVVCRAGVPLSDTGSFFCNGEWLDRDVIWIPNQVGNGTNGLLERIILFCKLTSCFLILFASSHVQ